jgi:hypothetical protein
MAVAEAIRFPFIAQLARRTTFPVKAPRNSAVLHPVTPGHLLCPFHGSGSAPTSLAGGLFA